MTAGRWREVTRTVTLSAGAITGVVCVLWTVGLWALGLHPLVFLSGSMSPAIDAGAVGFARTVPAEDIGVGDIVSVVTDEGVRVTHRVVSTVDDDAGVTLRLKGDANNTPDAHAYTLETVDLVVGHVAGAGYVLQGAASPWGMAAGAGLLAVCLVFGLRRRSGDPRSDGDAPGADHARRSVGDAGTAPDTRLAVGSRAYRVASVALVPLVLAGAAATPTAGTLAYFSDSAKVSTVVDGVDAAPWFTCTQSVAAATYSTQPWTHLSFNESSVLLQTSSTTPYFLTDTNTAWDGIYFQGSVWNGMLPTTSTSHACWRDTSNRSVYLQGSTQLTTQYVRIQSQSQNENGPSGARWNTFSVNVWYKTDIGGLDDAAGVLAAYSQAGGIEDLATDRVLYLDKSGRLTFSVFNGALRFRNTSGGYADNMWHMATATLGPAGMCLYLDARIAGSCDPTVTTAYQSDVGAFWRFGYGYLSNNFQGIDNGNIEQRAFKGWIDDAAIWTRQLSATEIRDMYRAGLPIQP